MALNILPVLREGQDSGDVGEVVMTAVRQRFRPEFLNRLDEILLFHRLEREHMDSIVEIQLGFLERLLADRKVQLELDEAARSWLARTGYDPAFGARPLKRVIQRQLQNPLASLILEGEIADGDVVQVSADERGLVINDRLVEAA